MVLRRLSRILVASFRHPLKVDLADASTVPVTNLLMFAIVLALGFSLRVAYSSLMHLIGLVAAVVGAIRDQGCGCVR